MESEAELERYFHYIVKSYSSDYDSDFVARENQPSVVHCSGKCWVFFFCRFARPSFSSNLAIVL